MKKMFLTTLVLAAGMAFAQTPDSTATSQSSMDKVQGCLSGSSGNYSVSDQSGKSWKLAGQQSDLQKNVGHMVELQGAIDSTDNTTYNVSSVKSISDSCANSNPPSSSTSASSAAAPATASEAASSATTPEQSNLSQPSAA